MPWSGIGWFAALCATAGVAVWLRWSPFPLVLRVLVPLSFWMQYQYALVARSYVLFPLSLFAACAVFSRRKPHPVLFAAVAALLANVCMHGLVLSVVLSTLYVATKYRRPGQAQRNAAGKLQLVEKQVGTQTGVRFGFRWGSAALLLGFGWCIALYPALPAPDVGFVMGTHVNSGWRHTVLLKLIGEETGHIAPDPADIRYNQVPTPLPPRPPAGSSLRSRLGWQLRVPPEVSGLGDTESAVLGFFAEWFSELFWPIATSNLLAGACVLALVVWAWRRRGLLYLLPALALWLFGEFLWAADHHAGLLFVTVLACVWLVERCSPAPRRTRNRVTEEFALALLTLVVGLQVLWSVHALRADRGWSYDPSRATAQFLQAQPAGARIAGFYYLVEGIQPYFSRSPFFNIPQAWWPWDREREYDNLHRQVLASHPDMVVYSVEYPYPGIMRNQIVPTIVPSSSDREDPVLLNLAAEGYRETHRFCGERFARTSAAYRVCDVIFER